MMNEFIVWDEDLECFRVEDAFLLDTEDRVCNSNGELLDEKTYKPFKSIGKTDIEDKKIYADSSVVRLRLKRNKYDIGQFHSAGYFSYMERILSYVFIPIVKEDAEYYTFSNETMTELKIIGTLQEKPELLE